MNFYFNRCSISNTDIDIPVRFKLPTNYRKNIIDETKDLHDLTKYSYEFRTPSLIEHNINIFKNDKTIFLGFINIKFYHESNKDTETQFFGSFRNWILFVFKTNELKYYNKINGVYANIAILTYKLQFILPNSLFAIDPTTYEELKFFKEKSDKDISDKDKLFVYGSKLDETTLFISPKPNLEIKDYLLDLGLIPIKIKLSDKNEIKHILERRVTFIPDIKISGGSNTLKLINKITLNFKNYLNLFNDELNNFNNFSKFKKLGCKINNIEITLGDIIIFNFNKLMYKFLLVSPNDLVYNFRNNSLNYIQILPKYIPLTSKFYHYNEIFIKFNILNNLQKNIKILNIGGITPLEVIKYTNYNISNTYIKYINFYNLTEKQTKYLIKIKKIYNIDLSNTYTEQDIYLLPYLYPELYGKFNINIYTIYKINKEISMISIFYNIINIYVGFLVGLKYTAIDGIFILNLNNVSIKPIADIYLILKQYFKESYLYYPEIGNMVKDNNVFGIFKGFIGIPQTDLDILENILEQLKKQYQNNMIEDFNIYDPELRKEFNITKPIKLIDKRYKYIDGFLNIPKKSKEYEDTYKEIIEFNNIIYSKKLEYLKKLLYKYENNIIVNIPTPDQIMSSIMYCRKYNIPFNDKYTEDKLNNLTSKTILNDMYGLQEPILHKFKTPFQTYIVNKIVLNPKLKSRSSNKSHSIFKTVYSSSKLTKTIKANKHNKYNKHKNSIIRNSFFNNLFESKKTQKSHKSHKTSHHKTSKNTSLSLSLFKRTNVSLDKALFNSNNSIVQAGLMIDSRKDFTKANPNEDYENFRDQFRYYRSKGRGDKQPNLNIMVQNMIGDNNISQAWLKMYEIISECGIVPLNKSGVFKSFHFCEAPGTFINCLNNYVYTKTKFNNFEWMAQSLHPRLAKIKDAYGIIKRHPKNWDWGVDGTGDITNPDNIRHYAKIIKLFSMASIKNMASTGTEPPFLITADAGLEPKDPKYKLVAYSSYVAILYSLPIHGTMIYKIRDLPLDLPLIWNLIYITYTNFKEMYFFKPVQNSQSLEFYIIAKDYLGIDTKVLEYLMKQIGKFGKDKDNYEAPDIDLFDDMYPEEFVVQLSNIYEKLANNYINSIERIIYYVDNKDLIGKDYIKHIKGYVEEKNEDWIRKYKIKRLDRNKLL